MKRLSRWITPCLILSAHFTAFAEAAPAQGDKRQAPARAQRQAPARPAPQPRAQQARPAAAQPLRKAQPAPPVRKQAAPQQNKARPQGATSPQAAQARQKAQQQVNRTPQPAQGPTPQQRAAQVQANQERAQKNQQAARQQQAERTQAAQQKAREGQAAARQQQADRAQANQANQERVKQNQEAARQQQAERAQANQERAQQNQAARQQQAAENRNRAQEAQERARDQQQQRQGENAAALERQRQVLRDRAADNQQRLRDNQEQARQNLADRQQANQERVRDAQDRLRDNQERLREQQGARVAENQQRLRDAQDRARQAQLDLNSRRLENVAQRREAYENARRLAAEARRPILERPSMNFRPGWVDDRRQDNWRNRWGSNWDRIAAAREQQRIASNYQRAVNWSYRPNYWGSRPWWTNNANHNWYQGSWNYGWNRDWQRRNYWYAPVAYPGYADRTSIASGVAWGLAAWGLGNLIYDTGYETYYNPYPTRYVYGDTVINYSEPMTEIAANYPVGDEETAKTSAEKSSDALARSRDQFKDEDYLAALKSVDESISYQPGDTSLHEYRALILFALGKYGDAAGVLNPVLASSPGWDYKTMVAFYRTEETYNNQLMKLESYVDSTPDAADSRFLLGYHHMVGGDLESAGRQFDEVVRLQPRDKIAKQLRDLVRSSVKTTDINSEPVEGDDRPDAVEPIATERLVGTWSTDRGEAGKVVLSLKDDGKFTWLFDKAKGEDTNLTGTYSVDDRGLLVLSSDDSQMVGEVTLPTDQSMVFVLAGGPDGDPGLNFTRD